MHDDRLCVNVDRLEYKSTTLYCDVGFLQAIIEVYVEFSASVQIPS